MTVCPDGAGHPDRCCGNAPYGMKGKVSLSWGLLHPPREGRCRRLFPAGLFSSDGHPSSCMFLSCLHPSCILEKKSPGFEPAPPGMGPAAGVPERGWKGCSAIPADPSMGPGGDPGGSQSKVQEVSGAIPAPYPKPMLTRHPNPCSPDARPGDAGAGGDDGPSEAPSTCSSLPRPLPGEGASSNLSCVIRREGESF